MRHLQLLKPWNCSIFFSEALLQSSCVYTTVPPHLDVVHLVFMYVDFKFGLVP